LATIRTSLASVALIFFLLATTSLPVIPSKATSDQFNPSVNTVPLATVEKQDQITGYQAVASKPNIIGIESTWIMPSVTCNAKSEYYQYVLIEIVLDSKGEDQRAGSAIFCQQGSTTPNYDLFYYLSGTYSSIGPFNAGDLIIASLTFDISTGVFSASLQDTNTGYSNTFQTAAGLSASMTDAEMVVSVVGLSGLCPSAKAYICPLPKFGTIIIGSYDDLPNCPGNINVASPCVELKNGSFHPLLRVSSATTYYKYILTNYAGTKEDASLSNIYPDHASFTVTFRRAGP
jgi:hypothetical protein